jgi:hypothetical protein
MERINKRKIVWAVIGFIVSWIIATSLFRPQPGPDSWGGTAGAILFYGYTWIIPIVGLLIGFSNDKNSFRKLMRNKYWFFSLIVVSVIIIGVSWNIRFSNDMFFVLCWILTTLWWLTIYFQIKSKKK